MHGKTITILCSGVALGVYIPAILVDYQLRCKGAVTEVVVLESLMVKEKQAKIIQNKKAFHQSFRVALTGQKMAQDLRPSLDHQALEELFSGWLREKRRNFIVFSGFWMSILMEYRKRFPFLDLQVENVHMDAAISASWKTFKEESQLFNNIWLFDGAARKLHREIAVTGENPAAYDARPGRFVIHGGGWGMGTYQSIIPELEEREILLDIVVYDRLEASVPKPGNRYFMVDPTWSPWHRNRDNRHEFPPFGEIMPGKRPAFKNKPEYHELFDLIRMSKAIISKPGGATLIDSLSAATPLVMLEPFGGYEQENAGLWESLGFGIAYPQWRQSGFSLALLEELHQNLLRTRGTLLDYTTDYFQRNPAASPCPVSPDAGDYRLNRPSA
jgi:hypothetical protein